MLILDSDGTERHRIEGYMPNREFTAQLQMGLARIAFKAGRYQEAEQRYGRVADEYGDVSAIAPEALYWRAVSRYKATGDGTALGEVAGLLKERYPQSEWTTKAQIWSG